METYSQKKNEPRVWAEMGRPWTYVVFEGNFFHLFIFLIAGLGLFMINLINGPFLGDYLSDTFTHIL